jgi:hypothetical protein
MPFEDYVTLMKREARSEYQQYLRTHKRLTQGRLWAWTPSRRSEKGSDIGITSSLLVVGHPSVFRLPQTLNKRAEPGKPLEEEQSSVLSTPLLLFDEQRGAFPGKAFYKLTNC